MPCNCVYRVAAGLPDAHRTEALRPNPNQGIHCGGWVEFGDPKESSSDDCLGPGVGDAPRCGVQAFGVKGPLTSAASQASNGSRAAPSPGSRAEEHVFTIKGCNKQNDHVFFGVCPVGPSPTLISYFLLASILRPQAAVLALSNCTPSWPPSNHTAQDDSSNFQVTSR